MLENYNALPPPRENPPTEDRRALAYKPPSSLPLWQETSKVHALPGPPGVPPGGGGGG